MGKALMAGPLKKELIFFGGFPYGGGDKRGRQTETHREKHKERETEKECKKILMD